MEAEEGSFISDCRYYILMRNLCIFQIVSSIYTQFKLFIRDEKKTPRKIFSQDWQEEEDWSGEIAMFEVVVVFLILINTFQQINYLIWLGTMARYWPDQSRGLLSTMLCSLHGPLATRDTLRLDIFQENLSSLPPSPLWQIDVWPQSDVLSDYN